MVALVLPCPLDFLQYAGTSPTIAVESSQCQETILHFNISGLETGRCRYVTLWHRWSEIDEDNPSLVALVLPCPLNLLQYAGTLSIGAQQLAPLPVEIQPSAANSNNSGFRGHQHGQLQLQLQLLQPLLPTRQTITFDRIIKPTLIKQ